MFERHRKLKLFPFLAAVSIAAFPLLAQYGIAELPISLGHVSVILFSLLSMLQNKRLQFDTKTFFIGVVLAFYNFIPGIYYSNIQNALNNALAILMFFGVLALSIPQLKATKKVYRNAYLVLALASTAFIYVQYSVYKTSGLILYGKLPFLEDIFTVTRGFDSITYGRPTSFFSEPSHYAIFMAPITMYCVLRKKYILAVLFVLGLLASTSSLGYVVIVACFVIAAYRITDNPLVRIVLFMTLGLCLIGVISYGDLDLSKFTFSNLATNVRVFGSFEYFRYFDFFGCSMGVGFNALESYLLSKGFAGYNYSNAFLFIVMSYGGFGIFAIILFMRWLFRRRNLPMMLIFVLVLLSDQILFNQNFYCLLIATMFMEHKKTRAANLAGNGSKPTLIRHVTSSHQRMMST